MSTRIIRYNDYADNEQCTSEPTDEELRYAIEERSKEHNMVYGESNWGSCRVGDIRCDKNTLKEENIKGARKDKTS